MNTMTKEQATAWLVDAYLGSTEGTFFINEETAEAAALALSTITGDGWKVQPSKDDIGPIWLLVKAS